MQIARLSLSTPRLAAGTNPPPAADPDAEPYQDSVVRQVHTRVHNWLADRTRGISGGGAAWKMDASLARELVKEGDLFMLPLFSGMQTPIMDAVNYLAKVNDRSSIGLLRDLFERYTQRPPAQPNSWGPADYMPLELQGTTAKALLQLMTRDEAKGFVTGTLNLHGPTLLADDTVSAFLAFARQEKMGELAPFFVTSANRCKREFDDALTSFQRRGGSMSFENLYKYEDMAYGAYHLASTPAVREEALQLLVTEYNHPQSARFEPGARPHDHIDQIMCRLVEDDLKGQAESLRIRGMLNPFRYARDVDYYEKMRKFRK